MGNEYFPATSFQVSKIDSGAGASNIIPGVLTMDFNFRYSTETDADSLKNTVISILDDEGIDYSLKWSHSGEPYLSRNSKLLDVCSKAIHKITNKDAIISTDGGTSDGRFMAKICNDVIEFGLVNKSIHKINESTTLDNINIIQGSRLIYFMNRFIHQTKLNYIITDFRHKPSIRCSTIC